MTSGVYPVNRSILINITQTKKCPCSNISSCYRALLLESIAGLHTAFLLIMCAVSFQEKIELACHLSTLYLTMASFICEDTQIILKNILRNVRGVYVYCKNYIIKSVYQKYIWLSGEDDLTEDKTGNSLVIW